MDYIKAVNYTGFNYSGTSEGKAKESLAEMKRKTACNTVILIVTAFWDSKESSTIHYKYPGMPSDCDILDFCRYAGKIGLQVALKPIVYFIREEDKESPIWRQNINHEDSSKAAFWLNEYTEFILHYAKLAERCHCEIFFAGSHLEHIQHKTFFWKNLIKNVRDVFNGMITYESISLMEDTVCFWNDVDIISSTGCFAKSSFLAELEHLEKLTESYNKPVILSECGCRSVENASETPQVWNLSGKLDLWEQEAFFQTVFQDMGKQKFIRGIGIWNWPNRIMQKEAAYRDSGYSICGKPACNSIRNFFLSS